MYDQSAAHWRQKVGTLGFLFRALRKQRLANNNTYSALSHYVHEKGALTPLNARLHVWCPRRDSKGLRFAKPRGSDAWRPRHAPLQTGRRPVCLTLRALTRVRHEKGGRNPLEAQVHVWCPRRDSKGLRFAKPRASGAWRPRHAPLQTGHRPVCLTLRALTRVRHEKGGLDPLERSLACMVPEARLELARCCQRWILSPLRLPIPPLGHVMRELVYHSFLLISPKMELRAFR